VQFISWNEGTPGYCKGQEMLKFKPFGVLCTLHWK
jgi:hypothetical protein